MPAIFTQSLSLRPGLAIIHQDDYSTCRQSMIRSTRRRQGMEATPGVCFHGDSSISSIISSTTSTISYRSSSDSSNADFLSLPVTKPPGQGLSRVKREMALVRSARSKCLSKLHQPSSMHRCFTSSNSKPRLQAEPSTIFMDEEDWGYFVDCNDSPHSD
jgi:hypothetical protein